MKIATITVSAQRKHPHPAVDFANYSGFVSLTAEVEEGENPAGCFAKLQAQADNLIDGWMDRTRERLTPKVKAPADKMQDATAKTAASLAAKHGGSL